MRRIRTPYYGWTVVGVLCAFGAVGVGLAGANFALFIGPMSDELGWSASTFGWAIYLRLAMILAAGPVIGRILDLRGPRLPVLTATLVAAALTLWLSRVGDVWELLLAFAVMGLFGMGRANDLQASAPAAQWFVRRRGLAMGVALAGTPLGVAVYYPLTQLLIDLYGWRDALSVLAVSGAVIVVPLSFLLRRRPEDMGLSPDGDRKSSPSPDRAEGRGEGAGGMTRREAMATGRFWLLLAGFTAMTFGLSALTIFRVPHFIERGFSPSIVAAAISVDAVVAVAASVALGRELDRLPARLVLGAGLAAGAFCAVGLIVVDSVFWLFAANIGYALGFQITHVAQSVLWADHFGRRHQGDIRGLTIPVTVGVGALAFPATGYLRDLRGDYEPAWALSLALLAVAGALLLAAREPSTRR